MSNQAIEEVCEILDYISDNNTVPRNIREAASQSCELLKDDEQDQSVRISTVLDIELNYTQIRKTYKESY